MSMIFPKAYIVSWLVQRFRCFIFYHLMLLTWPEVSIVMSHDFRRPLTFCFIIRTNRSLHASLMRTVLCWGICCGYQCVSAVRNSISRVVSKNPLFLPHCNSPGMAFNELARSPSYQAFIRQEAPLASVQIIIIGASARGIQFCVQLYYIAPHLDPVSNLLCMCFGNCWAPSLIRGSFWRGDCSTDNLNENTQHLYCWRVNSRVCLYLAHKSQFAVSTSGTVAIHFCSCEACHLMEVDTHTLAALINNVWRLVPTYRNLHFSVTLAEVHVLEIKRVPMFTNTVSVKYLISL